MQLPKHLKVAAGSGGAAIFGIIFGWVMFPAILKGQLKKEMALSKKTDVRQMWEKIPFALEFKVYLFNYTNVEDIQKGAKPIVKEIGPYHFDEWKEKVEIEDHEEDDTITYKKIDKFDFRPDLSGPGLTGEEEVILPHIFMLSLITTVHRDKPAMLNMIGKAVNGIFENPTDVFLRIKVMDLLFRGILLNCARTEFAPKAVCTALKKEAADQLVFEPNNQYRFSLFGMRNNTVDKHVVTVKRGIQNVMEVGQVVAIDGKPQMESWRDSCNEYGGTDGTVFPPFLTEFDRIQSFSSDLCRSFKPWYQRKTSYRGIKTNRYVANIGDFVNDPELQCFCDKPEKCVKGLMDLTKCMNAPLYVTSPHFLDTDPKLIENVKGLSPDVNEHGIEIDFEPISGTPMVAKQRVQFNIELLKAEKLELCKDLPGSIVPLFWIEEGLALNKTFVNMLKHQLFIPKRIVGVIRWLLVVVGTLGLIGSMAFHFKGRGVKAKIRAPNEEGEQITERLSSVTKENQKAPSLCEKISEKFSNNTFVSTSSFVPCQATDKTGDESKKNEDFSDLDSFFDSPRKAKMRRDLCRKIKLKQKHQQKINSLRRKNQRLNKKIASFKQIIGTLKSERYIDNDIHNILSSNVFAAELYSSLKNYTEKLCTST